MNTRTLLLAGLLVALGVSPASAQHRGYSHYWNSPAHTAFGIYPYSYSNPAFRAGGGTVAGADAMMMRQMQNMQSQALMQQQRAVMAQQKAMMAAAAQAKSKDGDKNSTSSIANAQIQQHAAPHVKSKQEIARERARKREVEGVNQAPVK